MKTYLRIIVRQHRAESETNGIAERAVRRIKRRHLCRIVAIMSGWKWLADSMDCDCFLLNIQDFLSDGKTPYARRFGEPLKGPIIHLVRLSNITLFLPKTCRDSTNSGKNVLTRILLGYVLYAGGIWKGDFFGRRHWGIGKDGPVRKSILGDSMQRKC